MGDDLKPGDRVDVSLRDVHLGYIHDDGAVIITADGTELTFPPEALITAGEHDYGPLRTYQIIWKAGHVETVQGHQVSISGGADLFGDSRKPVRFTIHGMFPGRHWRMMLTALEEDVISIRDVTAPEVVNEG